MSNHSIGDTSEAADNSRSACTPELLELIARLKKGDEKVVEQIVTLTQNRLYRFCFYLTSHDVSAEDLTQETLLKAFDRIKELKQPEGLFPWLFKIAKNSLIDIKRSTEGKLQDRLNHEDTEEDLQRVFDLDGVAQGDMDTLLDLKACLSELPEQDRVLLLMVDHEGLSYEEVAKSLSMSVPAVRSKIPRVRQAFLKLFRKEER